MSKVSTIKKLRDLLSREAPEQAATIREAIAQSARTGNEASVVGPANLPRRSKITMGRPDTVQPNVSDRTAALDYAQPGQGIIDFHTHPYGADDSKFLVRPSSTDLGYFNTNYKPGDFYNRELRTLIVQPPSLRDRMPAAYSMFATDKPAILAPRLLDTARNELGMAARKGRFSSIMDDPTFRDYFDYGGELSDLIADAAPMLMLRHRAAQGVGRHEYELSGPTITPNPESTEANLLKRLEPTALEVLRERKYAKGGAVTASRSADMAEENRPFIGYRSAGRRPESQQNRRASADAPLAALRGAVSGVLGAPGDIESLVRMLPGLNEQTVLPTSEDVRGRLPGRSLESTPVGRAATELGTLGGGFYTGPGSPLRAIAALPSAVSRAGRDFAMASGQPAVNVVKPKGGNWLAGSVERAIEPMRPTPTRGQTTRQLAEMMPANEWIGLSDEAGQVSDYVRNLGGGKTEQLSAPDFAMNRWLETKLAKYIRNEMATPEDPLRALADRGVTHIPEGLESLERVTEWIPETLESRRKAAGFPAGGMSQTPYGQGWEQLADQAIHNMPARMRVDPDSGGGSMIALQTEKDNPWLMKVPPDTMTYGAYPVEVRSELAFEHLVDELRNAVNPESGLPASLSLKYSDLEKVTVPQAVERVAKINDWRAAQKAEADMARAMNPATQVVKEYPEKGFKWVELRQPKETGRKISVEKSEMDLPPDMDQRQMREVAEDMAFDEGFDEGTPEFNNFVRDMMTDFNRKKKVEMDESIKALEDALKYEGETMGHCVGGYCPDVVEGRSKIYSLRDKKGQPHVTIEVRPAQISRYEELPEEIKKDIYNTSFNSLASQNNIKIVTDKGELTPWGQKMIKVMNKEAAAKWLEQNASNLPMDIVQIKGKGNKAPKEDYLPAVQDFVRSGNFGRVGDLQNTGLVDLSRASFSSPQLEQRAVEELGGRYVTQQDFTDWIAKLNPPAEGFSRGGQVRGYAEGGMVSGANFPTDDFDPARIDAIVDELHAMNAA